MTVYTGLSRNLCARCKVIGQASQFSTSRLETSHFMAAWSKLPHSPVLPPHTTSPKRLVFFFFVFHLSIQISVLLCFQLSAPVLADQTRLARTIVTVYTRGCLHCLNSDVAMAIINIAHTLRSAVCLQNRCDCCSPKPAWENDNCNVIVRVYVKKIPVYICMCAYCTLKKIYISHRITVIPSHSPAPPERDLPSKIENHYHQPFFSLTMMLRQASSLIRERDW